MSDSISVEVAYATPDEQFLERIELKEGATVADAISASGIAQRFPGLKIAEGQVGVWSKPMARETLLRDGDRVEIYRPLEIDPRDARRKIAESGGVMGTSGPSR